MIKVYYLLTHPIQYQSPLINLYSKVLKKSLKIFYISDFSLNSFYEKDFSSKIKWDVNLLKGQNYSFLNINQKKHYTFINPFLNLKYFKILIFERPQYLVVHGWSNINSFLSIIFAKFLKISDLIRGESYIVNESYIKNLLRKFYYKFLLFFPDYYLYIGKANKEFYLKYGSKRKLIPLLYTVNNKFIRYQASKYLDENFIIKNNLKDNSLKFFFVGKLIDRKNPMLILKSVNKIKKMTTNCSFYFIGDGPQREALDTYVKKNNLSNIYFLGFKNTSMIPRIVKYLDIFIFPSKQENWGLVLNEAIVLNKPSLVSSSVMSHYDLINKKNGLIFENNNINDLADKILFIINNKNEISTMQKNCKKIMNKFSYKNNLFSIFNYFKK